MIACPITNRHSLRGDSFLSAIARVLATGPTWLQIREKDLSARDLYTLVRAIRALPNPNGTKLIVNTRADVAMAAGADGVHLPSDSPDARRWRALTPSDFLIGVSCHDAAEAVQAESQGANYILFGPVFAPLSKSSPLSPRGLEELRRVARRTNTPVLALGGITDANAGACVSAGAAGVAGISLFLTAAATC